MALDLVARLRVIDEMSSPMKRMTSHISRMESVSKRTTASVKSFGASFAGLTSAIGVTQALTSSINMVRNSIGRAMDRIDTMERYERTMTTMLGSTNAAKKSLEALNKVVNGTAYGLDTSARSVQNFVSRGIEVGKATKWFEAMGDAVAFYGDGSNEQLESVTTAMAKMATSGKVSIQHMETLNLAGIDAVGMYAKAVGSSTTVVQKALSKGKIDTEQFFDVVTKAMMEGTNGVQKIAGTAKDAGATWAGAIANMQFAVVRGVTAIISALDDMLANNGLPSMREMVGAFGQKFESVLKGAASAIQPFINVFKKMYGVVKPVVPALKTFGKTLGIALISVAAGVKAFGLLAAGVAFLASPVGLVVGAVTALALGFQAAYKYIEPFRGGIDKAVGAVKGLFKAMSGDGAGAMNAMLAAGLDTNQIKGVYKFADGVKGAFDRVKGVIAAVGKGDAGGIATALGFSPETVAKITGFVDGIKTRAGEFVAYLSQKWTELQPGVAALMEAFTIAKEAVVNVLTSLWSYAQPVFSALGTAFQIIGDIAVSVFNNVIAPAVKFAMTMFQTLWKIVGPILGFLGEAIKLSFSFLKIAWDTILKPVAEFLLGGFKDAFEEVTPIVEKIGGVFEWIGDKISIAADFLKGFADKLKNVKVPDWLSSFGGKVANVFSGGGRGGRALPGHYHGLSSVPYDGYLARLHRGERVLTRQEADDMDARYSFDGVTGGNASYDYRTYNSVTNIQSTKADKPGAGGVTITGNTFNVRQESDIEHIAEQLYVKINGASEAGA